ncbi:MAG: protein ImuB [Lentisphaeria bacterium]|jgi:protein ImuB
MTSASSQKPQKLWLALRLTHLPLESLGIRADSDNAMMISHKGRICACTHYVQHCGITPGMPNSTAQLLNEDDGGHPWRTYEKDVASEARCVKRLCDALYNLTPYIEPYTVTTAMGMEDSGVLLELSRCIVLFKGLAALVALISETVETAGLSCRYGQAHTKHMAWLLSYSQDDYALLSSTNTLDEHLTRDHFIQQASTLPVEVIHEYPSVVSELKKSGFFTLGDIVRHIEQESLHSLTLRFGDDFSEYLADTLDISGSTLQPSLFRKPTATYQPDQVFLECIQFDYPVSNSEQLHPPMQLLLQQLSDQFVQRQRQTQSIAWHLYDIHRQKQSLAVHFDWLYHNTELAFELSRIQLENQALPFEVDTLELACEHIFPVNFSASSLDIGGVNSHLSPNAKHQALTITTAKLTARLGDKALFTLIETDSHIPELSFKKRPVKNTAANEKYAQVKKQQPAKTDHPSWIFNIPNPIGKRQNDLFWRGKLEILQGPERIEGLWWKKPTARDYFVAQRDDNVRLWVFFDLHKNEWFVHGVFA